MIKINNNNNEDTKADRKRKTKEGDVDEMHFPLHCTKTVVIKE